jgi:hypothetical protein
MKDSGRRLKLDSPATYQIKVQGRLGEGWADWLNGMTITFENGDNGVAITTLTGTVTDQVALHGVLNRIRDLALPLLLVKYVAAEEFAQRWVI